MINQDKNFLHYLIFFWTCAHHVIAMIGNIMAIIICLTFWKKIGKWQDSRMPYFVTILICVANVNFLLIGINHFYLENTSIFENEVKHMYTLWKLRKFSLTLFWQKFRERKVFTKEITK